MIFIAIAPKPCYRTLASNVEIHETSVFAFLCISAILCSAGRYPGFRRSLQQVRLHREPLRLCVDIQTARHPTVLLEQSTKGPAGSYSYSSEKRLLGLIRKVPRLGEYVRTSIFFSSGKKVIILR